MLLILVAVTTAAVCVLHNIMLKQKGFNTDNSKMSAEEGKEIVTNTNAAYKQTATTSYTELEVMYDTTSLVEGLSTTKPQQPTDNQHSTLNMDQNVAYESSTATQMSLSTNIAYYVHKSGKALQENDHYTDDQYDYI